MKLIIPAGDQGEYSSVSGIENINVACPAESFLQFLVDVSGKAIYVVADDWNGSLEELRKQNKSSLLDKIKKYNPFRRKNVSI